MKKALIMATAGVALGLTAGFFFFRTGSDPTMPLTNSESAGSKKIAYYQDPMHPWFTSPTPGKSPDCGMDMVPVYEGEEGEHGAKGIKIDPTTVQNIGVKVETIEKRKLSRIIRTVGKVDYDETKVYSVNTKVMGWVETLHVDYSGQRVHQGEPLLELYSPELISTQEEYLQSVRYRDRLQGSAMDEAHRRAEELVASARRRLLYWDIPESEIKALEERGTPEKTMTIVSPGNGVVIEKMVLQGQNVMPGMELYKIADLSTVWVMADIYPYELPWVKAGQDADIELSYLPGTSFQGTIAFIYPYLSTETKTAKVRIEVKNTPSFDLKPDMFATVRIASPVSVDAVAVPSQAIIRSGDRNVVVIALGGGYFDPRVVTLGVAADGYVAILDGVKEGESIVVSSQFLIDSESNLKAAIGQLSAHQHGSPAPETMSTEKLEGHEGHRVTKESEGTDAEGAREPGEKIEYTCTMHPEVVSDKPGDCPKCGMPLKPRTTVE